MKVELYLQSINQEMIDAGIGKPELQTKRKTKGAPPVAFEWNVWIWKLSCCILDFSLPSDDLISLPERRLRGYMLRKEKEGGMFWDPRTGAVYKVDEEAYHTLIELDRGLSELMIARRMNTTVEKVARFKKRLIKLQRQTGVKRQ